MPKLTKRVVESLAPGDRDYTVWDEALPGFGIRIWPSGKRVYILKYRNQYGRQRKPVLGVHGPMTADQARDKALSWLGKTGDGADPSGERQEGRRAPTLPEFAERYLREHAAAKKAPRSLKEDRRLIENVLLPEFRTRKLAEITRSEVAQFHHRLRATPVEANRALSLLSRMFNLAESWGLRPDHTNPCFHVPKYKEKKRQRYLTPAEFSRLGAALNEAEKSGSELGSAIAAIRLLIFSGARLSEILTLQWDYVNWGQKRLDLPDSKTGAKIIYLNEPALTVLSRIEKVGGNPFVIVGGKAGSYLIDLEKPWQRLRVRAGINDIRLHDLRHSFASVGVSNNLSLPIIGALLGHREAATTARYAHLAADPIRHANDRIGAHLIAALNRPARENEFEQQNETSQRDSLSWETERKTGTANLRFCRIRMAY